MKEEIRLGLVDEYKDVIRADEKQLSNLKWQLSASVFALVETLSNPDQKGAPETKEQSASPAVKVEAGIETDVNKSTTDNHAKITPALTVDLEYDRALVQYPAEQPGEKTLPPARVSFLHQPTIEVKVGFPDKVDAPESGVSVSGQFDLLHIQVGRLQKDPKTSIFEFVPVQGTLGFDFSGGLMIGVGSEVDLHPTPKNTIFLSGSAAVQQDKDGKGSEQFSFGLGIRQLF
jgi:hypothetical protein